MQRPCALKTKKVMGIDTFAVLRRGGYNAYKHYKFVSERLERSSTN